MVGVPEMMPRVIPLVMVLLFVQVATSHAQMVEA